MKFFKPGKVVLMLNGRYAGKKAVIVKSVVHKSKQHSFSRLLVAGLRKSPRKITRNMSARRTVQKSGMRPFVKVVNFSHVLPTRYTANFPLKNVVTFDKVDDPVKRRHVRKIVKKIFQKQYRAGESKWFFEKLRF
ncbi:putative Ribosomal protein L27, component of cytosolic 80S ribosome and 60S large subunit [Monocercomonoides exilis]|uniref:putative Ribosomal protein L27, component of cytosolic 80S ribosome and 60S large subunit n=1 Tax=Monocercomonoides exilis TaxID=2049356 RepID=UPI00355A7564|nr:putative Ribosomal protein L27, component of cytosolic 80S ribosome and 60S large subunit [Monocercomonoides exilis]|eukprot:MONOS_14606.1-p1 / transcript=MONOS_14606.1 / gene=MONOS_14606 / organism=Monocercomonoides_exilis_PA203 / gene_product=Ribosomal protein L27, component of cytosolic 80S ribosome and 60S large subunit / transcript_product=Ribosomal protein L27, component of cytosolic 80S ribosome and 60S large subunit / location=Mono_scaffold01034:14324-15034(+) / protein_length=134 / sequence_SO=supercontig / SO=protein_coding / is_pseudo=false